MDNPFGVRNAEFGNFVYYISSFQWEQEGQLDEWEGIGLYSQGRGKFHLLVNCLHSFLPDVWNKARDKNLSRAMKNTWGRTSNLDLSSLHILLSAFID